MTKETIENLFPANAVENRPENWTNGIKGWYMHGAKAGLRTLDIEHVPDAVVAAHNDQNSSANIFNQYGNLCVHKCKGCFNEDGKTYGKKKTVIGEDGEEKKIPNTMMTLDQTMSVIDQAIAIAEYEGTAFESVKFLGPGELLMNPQLFDVLDAYKDRGIRINIFTKAALLGSDELAQQYQGMSAKDLTNRLASYDNVGLLMSFQSFEHDVAEKMVTTTNKFGTHGLLGYGAIRDQALDNIINSSFYQGAEENRLCMINAPISPENIDESFDIYKFFTERGIPVVMTSSMVAGKGKGLVEELGSMEDQQARWHNKLVELYAQVYAYNIESGIQTLEQIEREGVAAYAGAEPCNSVSNGLYIRANGDVQMCPGRNDAETLYGNVIDDSLEDVWTNSPNRLNANLDPQLLVNSRCPAKDGRAFPVDFYERVMDRFYELLQ